MYNSDDSRCPGTLLGSLLWGWQQSNLPVGLAVLYWLIQLVFQA